MSSPLKALGRLALLNLLFLTSFAALWDANPAQALSYGSPLFQQMWEYSDKLVQEDPAAGRSYTWGPNSFGTFEENYAEASGGRRQVQYFDKARMELAKKDGQEFVTNGLLTKELVTGFRQDGDARFTQLAPSTVQVAGDDNSQGGNTIAPTYASFRGVVSFNPGENRAADLTGQEATGKIDKNGKVSALSSADSALTRGVKLGYYDSTFGHNVPQIFVDFQNQTGLVWNAGRNRYQPQPIYTDNPTANVFGLAVSEAFWVRAVVAGVEKDVLVQLFERRVLTYTPSNADPFKVEMGNIGQHYFRWRYNPPAFVANNYSQARALYLKSGPIPQGGTGNVSSLASGGQYSSSWPVYDPEKKLAIVSSTDLVAVDISNFEQPKVRWRVTGPNGFTPITKVGNIIYVGGEGGRIFAINEDDGNLLWTTNLEGQQIQGVGFDSLILADADSLYLRFSLREPTSPFLAVGVLMALNRSDGSLRWISRPVGGTGISSGPVLGPDGTIYAGGADKKIYAFSSDGKLLPPETWTPPTLDEGPSKYAMSFGNDKLYVATSNGTLYAINRDGSIQSQKTFTPGKQIISTPAVVNINGNPRVYVGSDDGRYYGVDANNVANVLWTFEPPGAGVARSGPTVLDNYVYFGSDNGNIYRVDATNPANSTILANTNQPFGTVPPVVNSGYLVTITYKGMMYFIR